MLPSYCLLFVAVGCWLFGVCFLLCCFSLISKLRKDEWPAIVWAVEFGARVGEVVDREWDGGWGDGLPIPSKVSVAMILYISIILL